MIRSNFILIVFCIYLSCTNALAIHTNAIARSNHNSTKKHSTNDLLKSFLDRSAFRHKVLAQNIANVNTPNYKANDIKIPRNYNSLITKGNNLHKINLIKTSEKHISSHNKYYKQNSSYKTHKLEDPYEIKNNGNNVSIHQQMAEISQNSKDYSTAVKGYATLNALYGTVIGK